VFERYMLPPSSVLTTLILKKEAVCSSKTLVYSNYSGNKGAICSGNKGAFSISNTDHYIIIRKLLDFNFNILWHGGLSRKDGGLGFGGKSSRNKVRGSAGGGP
jgi:hypothetical protein